MAEPLAPTWTITGRFRSNESGRVRGTVLRYWAPEDARAQRLLLPLVGDTELVALVIYDASIGRLVSPTPTSDQKPAAIDDAALMFLAAARYFEAGYTVEGNPGVEIAPVPEGAQA